MDAIKTAGELKTVPVPPTNYGTAYTYRQSADSVVVAGEVHSKANLTKAGVAAGGTAYFWATSGGGCFKNALPADATATCP
jgi:hypothetical protein